MLLKKIIEKGESKTVEFKETIPNGRQIFQTAVAFANGAGGKILGVNERDDIFRVVDLLNSMIYGNCYPQKKN